MRSILAALALTACTGSTPPPEPMAPDMIVVTLDTTRADHLGLYGYFRDTSPTLDALAAESVVFDDLVVPMATTLPTHTSLFTATWPLEHGVLANVSHGGQRFVPSQGLRSLASWASTDGPWTTAAFVSAAPLASGTGIEAGFDVFSQPERYERPAQETTDAALAWLDGQPKDRPVLLWVHYYDPHNPYVPPGDLKTRYKNDEALDAYLSERHFDETSKRPTGEVVRTRRAINLYDAEIRHMDAQLGRLLEAVRARGRWDQTLLVVMGDHGEGLGQHGEPGHGLVWGEQLHAPLLIRAPGLAPRRVSSVTSVVDVLPTALHAAAIPGAEAWVGQASGRDVLSDSSPRPAISLTSARQREYGNGDTFSITTETWKYVCQQGGDEHLYHLGRDPFELTDVAASEPDALATLRAQLADQLRAHHHRGLSLGAGITEPMAPDRVDQLQALGYLDPHDEPTPTGEAGRVCWTPEETP